MGRVRGIIWLSGMLFLDQSLRGIALGNIVKRNIALTSKWLWRFPLERDSLLHAIIKSKYGVMLNGWDAQPSSRISAWCPW